MIFQLNRRIIHGVGLLERVLRDIVRIDGTTTTPAPSPSNLSLPLRPAMDTPSWNWGDTGESREAVIFPPARVLSY